MKKTTAVMVMLLAALAGGAVLIAGGGSTPVADVAPAEPAQTLVVAQDEPANPLVLPREKPALPLVVTQDQPIVYCCGGGPAPTIGLSVMSANTSVAQITKCDCSQTTLIKTKANVHFANFPAKTDWNGVVIGGAEITSADITYQWNNAGAGVKPGRFNVDIQASKIRIEFARDATYGQPVSFTFTLNPLAPPNCGKARIVGSSVTSNRADAAAVLSLSSFSSTANTVTIQFGNHNPGGGQGQTPSFADWKKNDWIEAQLTFDCETTSNASTCCPPVNKQIVQGLFKHEGNAATGYTMPLDTSVGATTTSFVNGLNAYFTYLHFVCPQTNKLKVEFFTGPVSAPTTPGGPAGPLGATLLPAATITTPAPAMTIALLNNALSAGPNNMNNWPRLNGQYYRISVQITGVDAQGQPVNCGFNAKECALDDTFGFVFNVAGSPKKGSKFTTESRLTK
jgi:hypothetical protein